MSAAADAARGFLLLHDEPDLATTALAGRGPAPARGCATEQGTRRALADRQRLTGAFDDDTGSLAATGQALVALGSAADPELVGPVAKAGHWIERKRRVRKAPQGPEAGRAPPRRAPAARSSAPPTSSTSTTGGRSPDWPGPRALLQAEGQLEAAVDAWRFARGLASDVDRSIAAVLAAADALDGSEPGRRSRPVRAGPSTRGWWAWSWPRPWARSIPRRRRWRPRSTWCGPSWSRESGGVLAGVLGDDGWSPWLTALLAQVEIGLGDPAGLDPPPGAGGAGGTASGPSWSAASPSSRSPSPTTTRRRRRRSCWPPGPCSSSSGGRSSTGPTDSPCCPVAVPEWYGQGIELHDAPTAFGHLRLRRPLAR